MYRKSSKWNIVKSKFKRKAIFRFIQDFNVLRLGELPKFYENKIDLKYFKSVLFIITYN